jgi:hypothetical protein
MSSGYAASHRYNGASAAADYNDDSQSFGVESFSVEHLLQGHHNNNRRTVTPAASFHSNSNNNNRRRMSNISTASSSNYLGNNDSVSFAAGSISYASSSLYGGAGSSAAQLSAAQLSATLNSSATYYAKTNNNNNSSNTNSNNGAELSPGRSSSNNVSPSSRRASVFTTASGSRYYHDGGGGPPIKIHAIVEEEEQGSSSGGNNNKGMPYAPPLTMVPPAQPGRTNPTVVASSHSNNYGPRPPGPSHRPFVPDHAQAHHHHHHHNHPHQQQQHHPHHHQYQGPNHHFLGRQKPILEDTSYVSDTAGGPGGRPDVMAPCAPPPPPRTYTHEPIVYLSAPSRRCLVPPRRGKGQHGAVELLLRQVGEPEENMRKNWEEEDELTPGAKMLVQCSYCLMRLYVDKMAVVVQCPDCDTVGPAASSAVVVAVSASSPSPQLPL